ncbi:MAG: hypothetical protein H7Z21_04320, partial [Hymenobacter sp.]|nr:hypothetical protein [Hymenobacter sp.]
MKFYFRLRLRILSRQLAELGWWRGLLLAPVLVAAIGNGLVGLARHETGQWVVPPLLLLLVLSQHRRRADLDFLHLSAPGFRPWLAVEYALWSGPAVLVLLRFGRVGAALLTLVLGPLAAWVPAARTQATTRHGRSVFRSEAFEWVSGFRQAGLWVGWLALVLAAGWWRPYPVAPALALGAWVLLLTALYA